MVFTRCDFAAPSCSIQVISHRVDAKIAQLSQETRLSLNVGPTSCYKLGPEHKSAILWENDFPFSLARRRITVIASASDNLVNKYLTGLTDSDTE